MFSTCPVSCGRQLRVPMRGIMGSSRVVIARAVARQIAGSVVPRLALPIVTPGTRGETCRIRLSPVAPFVDDIRWLEVLPIATPVIPIGGLQGPKRRSDRNRRMLGRRVLGIGVANQCWQPRMGRGRDRGWKSHSYKLANI